MTHSHCCPTCNTIWAHQSAPRSTAQNEAAHRCPTCGTHQYYVHQFLRDPTSTGWWLLAGLAAIVLAVS